MKKVFKPLIILPPEQYPAAADSFTDYQNKNTNYGGEWYIRAHHYRTTPPYFVKYGWIKFNITEQKIPKSAKLYLCSDVYAVWSGRRWPWHLILDVVRGAWEENTITWNNQPTEVISSIGDTWSDWPFTQRYYEHYIDLDTTKWDYIRQYGIRLSVYAWHPQSSETEAAFVSKEHNLTQYHPKLIVSYI